MKKLTAPVLLVGLTAILSACVVVATSPVSGFGFGSNTRRVSDNAFVFCTGTVGGSAFQAQVSYGFNATDPSQIASITEVYTGVISGRTLTLPRPVSDLVRSGNRLEFTGNLTFGQNGVPQSIGKGGVSLQAITVTPITNPPTSNNGRTVLTVRVLLASGTEYTGSYTYDTYANCNL